MGFTTNIEHLKQEQSVKFKIGQKIWFMEGARSWGVFGLNIKTATITHKIKIEDGNEYRISEAFYPFARLLSENEIFATEEELRAHWDTRFKNAGWPGRGDAVRVMDYDDPSPSPIKNSS